MNRKGRKHRHEDALEKEQKSRSNAQNIEKGDQQLGSLTVQQARLDPVALKPEDIRLLQNTVGNKEIDRLVGQPVQSQTSNVAPRSIIQLGRDPESEARLTRLWKVAHENPEGFTSFITGDIVPAMGFCVAYEETQNCFGEDGLARAYDIAQTQDGILGGWKDGGQYYFDSVQLVGDMDTAIKLAYRRHQLAFFNYGKHMPMSTNPLHEYWKTPP